MQNTIDDNMYKDIQPEYHIIDVNMEQKSFITSIHDRDLHNGDEVNYNINMDGQKNKIFSTNTKDDPTYVSNNVYSGIDITNNSLNGNHHVDSYNELLKRKENELFGTKHHTKCTNIYNVAKHTNSDDPLLNQLELFHKWLDRHRNMCEIWKNNKVEILDKLKEEWNKDNKKNNGENNINKMLSTDVSIQIDMDNPKPTNEFRNMDTYPNISIMDNILDDLEKYNEPYYYDTYEDDKPSVDDNIYVDHNNEDLPSKVQIELHVNNKIVKEKYPIADVWNI
ncbi:erythrocyte membrane protein 1, EMP1, fragment [Plasmodium reichenowi]|uniref:Erythrocyte membrane protein 1, EMP1 n=1 Tax=Plasmodium reichenowi TaxID=5854 RepID=A0A060RYZ7_PLARE|nr:erythrocyte membrane protein 1, EMP1, fragment [Plasmodium reichenowi]